MPDQPRNNCRQRALIRIVEYVGDREEGDTAAIGLRKGRRGGYGSRHRRIIARAGRAGQTAFVAAVEWGEG